MRGPGEALPDFVGVVIQEMQIQRAYFHSRMGCLSCSRGWGCFSFTQTSSIQFDSSSNLVRGIHV